jgi:hypothetical protein
MLNDENRTPQLDTDSRSSVQEADAMTATPRRRSKNTLFDEKCNLTATIER